MCVLRKKVGSPVGKIDDEIRDISRTPRNIAAKRWVRKVQIMAVTRRNGGALTIKNQGKDSGKMRTKG